MRRGSLGFTLVEIMIVVAIIGLLAAIAIPSYLKARETSRRTVCINNLRQIDGAKNQYALEHGGNSGDVFNQQEIATYIKGINRCFCPVADLTNRTFSASYVINALTNSPTCRFNNTGGVTNHDMVYSGS